MALEEFVDNEDVLDARSALTNLTPRVAKTSADVVESEDSLRVV